MNGQEAQAPPGSSSGSSSNDEVGKPLSFVQSIDGWSFVSLRAYTLGIQATAIACFVMLTSFLVLPAPSIWLSLHDEWLRESDDWPLLVCGGVCLVHWLSMVVARPLQFGAVGCFDILWACNTALVVAFVGCFHGVVWPLAATIGALAWNHLGFVIDLVALAVGGRELIGAFGVDYVDGEQYPAISWNFWSTSHHIWFCPLGIWALSSVGFAWDPVVVGASVLYIATTVTVGRWLAPFSFRGTTVNINSSYTVPHPLQHSLGSWLVRVCGPPDSTAFFAGYLLSVCVVYAVTASVTVWCIGAWTTTL